MRSRRRTSCWTRWTSSAPTSSQADRLLVARRLDEHELAAVQERGERARLLDVDTWDQHDRVVPGNRRRLTRQPAPGYHRHVRCGRSVVVAQKPSKLLGRVRFPSPACETATGSGAVW